MTRERLTWRQASMDKVADPNSLGRPDRKNPPIEKYETYEFTENHPYPDLSNQWKKDKRFETGHPAPSEQEMKKEAAQIEKKAKLALKLAEALFPSASQESQLNYAANFMEMSNEALLETAKGFRAPKSLEEEEAVEKEEVKVEAEPEADDLSDLLGEGEDKAEGDDVDDETVESVKKIVETANAATVESLAKFLVEKAGLTLAEEGEVEEGEGLEEVEEPGEGEVEEGEGLEEVTEESTEEEELLDGGLGINLSPATSESESIPFDDLGEMNMEEEDLLASLYSEDFVNSGLKQAKTASRKTRPAPKKGVQSLNAVRSNQKASKGPDFQSLSKLWKSDPDVSHYFDA